MEIQWGQHSQGGQNLESRSSDANRKGRANLLKRGGRK
jgi:hypothetical protein